MSPDTADPEAAGDAGEDALKDQSESGNVQRTSTHQWAQENDYEPSKLFNKFYGDDIKYLLSMGKPNLHQIPYYQRECFILVDII